MRSRQASEQTLLAAERSHLSTGQVVLRVLSILFVIGISAGIILYSDQLAKRWARTDIPACFCSICWRAPRSSCPHQDWRWHFAAGASLSPWLVGLAVGSGSTLGELTGYITGYSGRDAIKRDRDFDRVQGWMRRFGLWALFALSLVPNPLFDVAGIIAGVTRIPVWKFLAVTWCGKVIEGRC
jgi:hypothetical protein